MSVRRKPDAWQKKLIGMMLDAYERTGTYRGDTERNQNVRVPVKRVFPDYDRDDADLTELENFEQSMRDLETFSPVRIVYRDKRTRHEFREFLVPAGAVEPALYQLAGRKPGREIHMAQIAVYEAFKGKSPVLDSFIASQEELLRADKNAWFEPSEAEDVMRTVDLMAHNTENILYREISIALFGDTKYIERRGILSKAVRVLKRFGRFDFEESDFESKKEYDAAVLSEYAVYENPTYVNFNGNGEVLFRNGTKLELRAGVPIAVRSDRLADITDIRICAETVLTIENLTSYNRMQTDAFQLYLAGYHNHARQEFLVRIHNQNPDIRRWLHFGDLDPDGFCILENLRNKTGIAFESCGMDVTYLEKYRTYTKKLNENDRTKAENLIRAGKYPEVLTYMLEHDAKLEQEIISWKEGKSQTGCWRMCAGN
ncbi:MAG: DUF2220 family protein [Clostridiales bacterium]|nr:DUF2220 family protein [Clostridiales bacterium]